MTTKHLLALAVLLATQAINHASAATPGKFAGPLTATPSGQSGGHEILFKLPLSGDTQNCIITINYGDKPGAMPNNDGDTHLNGQASLDRLRTYAADGTYTFTAKAKSGCTGEAKVTFTIGNTARQGALPGTSPAIQPAPAAGMPPPVVVVGNPGLTVAHTKITSLQVSSTSMSVGTPFSVKVNGTGLETQCPTTVIIGSKSSNYYKVSDKVGTGAWPRVSNFVINEPGQYYVSVIATETAMLSEAERTACGFKYSYGSSGIPGSPTTIEIADIPK